MSVQRSALNVERSGPAGSAVFLSYASQDAEAVRRIAEALRAAGVEVWFDQNELTGGDAWDAKIRKQIAECALFVPIISAATQARGEGYFRVEWRLADRRTEAMGKSKAFLLPVCIDDTRDAEADVPDSFLAVQWTRLRAGDTGAAFCARVKRLIEGEPGPRPAPAALGSERPGAVAVPGKAPSLGRLWVGAAAVALVLWQPWRKAGPNPPAVATATRVASSPEVQELLRQIWQIYEKNNDASREDWALAEEIGARAVRLENNNPDAWAAYSLVAVTSWFSGYDYTDAHFNDGLSRAERAMSLGPTTIDARFAYANCLRMKTATRTEGERMLRELAAQAPTDKRILRTLAATLRMQGKYDEALAWLERALALSGGDVAALMGKASVLQQLGRDAEGEGVIEQILAVRPSPYAFLWKAYFQVSLHGDLPQAGATLEKIPATFLRKDDGAYLASRLALWRKDHDRSAAALRELTQDFLLNRFTADRFLGEELRTFLTGQAHQLAGRKAAAEIDWRAGLKRIEQRLATEPSQPLWLFWRARLLAHLAEPDAEKALEAFRQLAVADADTKFAIGLVLAPLGRLDEAIDAIAEAVREKSLAATTRKFWRLMLRYDPTFEPLRGNPTFDALVASLFPAQVATAASPTTDMSVAVLAFANLSADQANEVFSDGISEELRNLLSEIPGLKVMARASAFSFKGRNVPIPEIARQLGVAHVVDGSVRRSGNQVRITVQLLKAVDGFQVWSDTFRRELQDIFAVQDEIARLVAGALQLRLGSDAGHALTRGSTQNPAAYEAFLKGRHAYNTSTADYRVAVGHLLTAVQLDPRFALAHGALAEAYVAQANVGAEPAGKMFPLARAAAEQALALDRRIVQAYTALAECAFHFEWDYEKSDEFLRQALAVDPNYAGAHGRMAGHNNARGRFEEALAGQRRVKELDPFDQAANDAWTFAAMQRYPDAIAAAREHLARFPEATFTRATLGFALYEDGKVADAMRVFEELAAKLPDDPLALSALAWGLGRGGQTARARALLERMSVLAASRHISPLYPALAASGMGDRDLAFAQLERAFEVRDPHLPDIGTGPLFAPIRSDPRFRAMLQRLKLDRYFPEGPKK